MQEHWRKDNRIIGLKFYDDFSDYEKYSGDTECPLNEKLCYGQVVWIFRNILPGTKSDIEKSPAKLKNRKKCG